MTYLDLLDCLKKMEQTAPEKLNDPICVVGGTETPLTIINLEYNDGSISDVQPYQLLLMTV